MLFSPQMPLPLEPKREGRLDDFVIGPNRAAVDAVRAVVAEPDSNLFLRGPESSGKTFLLNGACLAAREAGMTAFYLGLKRVPEGGAGALDGLEGIDLVCVDDLDRVAGDDDWEEALFHLINRVRADHGRLVVSARENLGALPIRLPDLVSRLGWGLRAELLPLDDADKAEVMIRHARAQGADLPDDVVDYLLRRGSRDLSRLLDAADRLRQAAFTDKRRITVPLARQVLSGRSGADGT
ncbi:DnaA regulatory inactivator Hda [Marinihelvus fidelis]|uniref:DnaA regulatory inactivator Hda n=1 Tax=Marinihelvus fidelis TaxID=2613842 RepID=A0A5N0TJC5_9GAMM|nr:DnaA regulatory inactivator Hda [Marinihelvus fidelis]KAA9133409.1 DnaA regulatory inactivator Hda [Marinihelvus fidelis]